MSDQNEREDLLNATVEAYKVSVGHIPGEDQMPEIRELVDGYLKEKND